MKNKEEKKKGGIKVKRILKKEQKMTFVLNTKPTENVGELFFK